jgi:hypothetical protein
MDDNTEDKSVFECDVLPSLDALLVKFHSFQPPQLSPTCSTMDSQHDRTLDT